MASHGLTDNEIHTCVVATRIRWPETGTTIAWSRLHDCVDALQDLVRTVGLHCVEAEQNRDFSAAGIMRRRLELGRQALTELANFKPFQAAEKATLDNIDYLEKKMIDLPQPPTNVADVALAQEIRSYVSKQKSPIDVAVRAMSDHRILSAILNAPPFLSGLSDAEFKVVRERARAALHPEQVKMQQQLTKSLEELRAGLAATKRMLLERCENLVPCWHKI
jgi:hypothetical protein